MSQELLEILESQSAFDNNDSEIFNLTEDISESAESQGSTSIDFIAYRNSKFKKLLEERKELADTLVSILILL